MNNFSYFIDNIALFGCYPSKDIISDLRKLNVVLYIDVTHPDDNLEPYNQLLRDNDKYYNYQITDAGCPDNPIDFCKFLFTINNIIKNLETGQKIYVHCRGGHGRSGVIVASILCTQFNINPTDSIELTTHYHSNRIEMKDKWREIGSPQTRSQKLFLYRMFKELFFYKASYVGPATGLSTFSLHSVFIEGIGKFSTAEGAYQALKNPTNYNYVSKLFDTRPSYAKKLGSMYNLNYDQCLRNMEKVLRLKFAQHPDLKESLIRSYLRPIIFTGQGTFWGGINNNLGKLLCKIRLDFIHERS